MDVPSETDFLADARGNVSADLGRHCVVWQEVLAEILTLLAACKVCWGRFTYRLVPVDGNASAVNVGRCLVLEILEARVAGLLCIACLESKVEEATDAILGSCRGVIEDEAKAEGVLMCETY